jgi:hypothetical protein
MRDEKMEKKGKTFRFILYLCTLNNVYDESNENKDAMVGFPIVGRYPDSLRKQFSERREGTGEI